MVAEVAGLVRAGAPKARARRRRRGRRRGRTKQEAAMGAVRFHQSVVTAELR